MIQYLIKTNVQYRLETIDEVKAFEQKQRDRALNEGFTVNSFKYTLKQITAKGEVIDEFYLCDVVCTYNDAKEPENNFSEIEVHSHGYEY